MGNYRCKPPCESLITFLSLAAWLTPCADTTTYAGTTFPSCLGHREENLSHSRIPSARWWATSFKNTLTENFCTIQAIWDLNVLITNTVTALTLPLYVLWFYSLLQLSLCSHHLQPLPSTRWGCDSKVIHFMLAWTRPIGSVSIRDLVLSKNSPSGELDRIFQSSFNILSMNNGDWIWFCSMVLPLMAFWWRRFFPLKK